MTGSYALARRPEDIVPALLAHLNSLDTEVMLDFYDPEGMLVDVWFQRRLLCAGGGRPRHATRTL